MRVLRPALVTWAGISALIWAFGAVGLVVGGITFLAGWAIGHRTGRHEAEREWMEHAVREAREYRRSLGG